MKLGVPSKGRLKKEVLSWFNHKGVEIITSEDDRSYAAKVTGFSDIQLFFLPPVEIPTLLSKGVLDLGVTGQDLIEEKIPEWDKYVTELIKLGIGHADLVIAVPDFWVDVSNLEDLDEVAKIFRDKMGFRLRIATKYPNITKTLMPSPNERLFFSRKTTSGIPQKTTIKFVREKDTLRYLVTSHLIVFTPFSFRSAILDVSS